jgi:Tfp pilus assembly protein FimT
MLNRPTTNLFSFDYRDPPLAWQMLEQRVMKPNCPHRSSITAEAPLSSFRVESRRQDPQDLLRDLLDDKRHEWGFSSVEMVVVAAIILILGGFAVPVLMNTIYLSRVRGASSDLSGLVQQARILAERQNIDLGVYAGAVGTNATGAFIDTTGNGSTWKTGDPDIPFAKGVTNGVASNAPGTLNPGFTPESASTILYFSPRGLPVKSSGATFIASNGVVFYITDSHGDWAAVSVSGAGRSKVWVWNGGAWN